MTRRTSPKPHAEALAFHVIVRIERCLKGRVAASEIMQFGVDVEHNLPKLRRPSSQLIRARHEPTVVMDRLEQGDLKGIARIRHAE